MDARVKKIISDTGYERMLGSIELIISETGILEKNDFTETKYKWSVFIKKRVSINCYYQYFSSIQALVIPKRVFENAEKISDFEKILSEKLPFLAEFDQHRNEQLNS